MFPTVNLKRIISMAVVAGILVSCNNSSNTKKQTEVLPAKDITENTMEDKTLIVKELEFTAEKPSAQEIEDALNAKNVEYNQIDCVNWEGYNGDYTPDVKFRIGYTEKEIAAARQKSPASVRMHYCRMAKKLRKSIRDAGL